jgi:hypothetical protein
MVVEDMPVKIEIGLDKLRARSQRSVRTLLRKIVAERSIPDTAGAYSPPTPSGATKGS